MPHAPTKSALTALTDTRHELTSLADLRHLARALAVRVRPGDHLGLLGPLGAGKTTFMQYFAAALGASEVPESPTFAVRNVIRLGEKSEIRRLVHVDLYRLHGRQAIDELGLADDLTEPDTIVAIEWADRAPALRTHLRYRLEFSWEMTTDRRTLLIRETDSSTPPTRDPSGLRRNPYANRHHCSN